MADESAQAEELADARSSARQLRDCLRLLERSRRHPILLAFYRGLTHDQIAARLSDEFGLRAVQRFDAARAETENDSDLIPYWIYEGPVKVERRVPMLPFSREVRRLEWLKRSLTVYRLAFGQPRQEDLLEYLHSLMGTAMAAEDLADLQIRLQP